MCHKEKMYVLHLLTHIMLIGISIRDLLVRAKGNVISTACIQARRILVTIVLKSMLHF